MTTPVFTSSAGAMQFVVGTAGKASVSCHAALHAVLTAQLVPCGLLLPRRSVGRTQLVLVPLQGPQQLPAPTDDSVTVKQQPGGHYACATFSGVADKAQVCSVQCGAGGCC